MPGLWQFHQIPQGEREHEFPIRFIPLQANHTFNLSLVVRGNIRDEPPPDYSASETSTKHAEEKHIAATISESYGHADSNGQFSIQTIGEDAVKAPSMPMPDYSHFSPSEKGHSLIGTPFDLGTHLDIRLSQTGSATLGAAAESPFGRWLYPSFDTYNISLTYQLEWTIRLSCAGESHDVHDIAGVRVLPPSKEQDA